MGTDKRKSTMRWQERIPTLLGDDDALTGLQGRGGRDVPHSRNLSRSYTKGVATQGEEGKRTPRERGVGVVPLVSR